ncbi:DNA adenine methylase [Parabacteroides sp. AF48-14]|uniref:DNA adenine methylase n=1 Tax=Parabacteroides sp. AF48-14 TaxID=2292052 RepID=UPI000F001EC0|nr:DNA adenine methylase [Parabacteroides sp. AF48-14]RHO63705.1 DNA adenine methylase [Parabacteroides sp. AF48-14]
MRTPITYYGGKQRLADTIISMMPGHKLYCEPFFGGGCLCLHLYQFLCGYLNGYVGGFYFTSQPHRKRL